jgi:RNA polymerase sigma-70 factor (ECF subfamily)
MHTVRIDPPSMAADAPPPSAAAAPPSPFAAEPADGALIAAAVAGDTAAFESLYRRHAGRVYGLCLRLTQNRADAQDATQETFVSAWRQLATFRGDSGLATWLHRIALNQVLGRKRRAATEANRLEIVERESATSYASPELTDHLERAIAQLPQRAREVFVLQKVYGYTHEEVADLLNIAVGTCKAQVHRAGLLLMTILGGRL